MMIFNSIWTWGIVGSIVLGLVFIGLIVALMLFMRGGKKKNS
ncbi:hypothetical protein R3X25_09820 [Lutibacter sp. TH_r2]|nr:hypothetical protein [Lutibacter sp. TH_r2]MDV7187577.1 hypothetical protein [Lutibacter sp. TH_r2]